MELIVRLHRFLSARGQRYRVSYIPDPVCWTEAPEDLVTLAKQRKRWQRGLAESLWENRKLLFARGSGTAGWLAFPYFIVF
jgi:cellulose synthase/poly-beta-1,6-N-acetylglucosamine synthase-like glycosyltransferase